MGWCTFFFFSDHVIGHHSILSNIFVHMLTIDCIFLYAIPGTQNLTIKNK